MIRKITYLTLILSLCTAGHALADDYDDCQADCVSALNQCIEAITLYDAAGIQEAKAVCTNERVACKQKCHEIDSLGMDGYQEKLKNAAEEAARRSQEQELENNGGIKTLNLDH
jgi:hypothetical protein